MFVYAKFLEAIQSFERECNIRLLSFVCSDLIFFFSWHFFCFLFTLMCYHEFLDNIYLLYYYFYHVRKIDFIAIVYDFA